VLTGEAIDMPVFKDVFDTNVQGMVQTFQPFVAAMMKARRGALVGVASVAGFRGLPGSGAYSASKAAAIIYLESLRVELAGSGVAVVTICPGFIATPMTARTPYRMPFLIAPDKAARLIAGAIDRRRRFYVLPWQMAWVGRLLKLLPRPLYEFAFRRAGRKPRQSA
jgi:short-subunit dehydrogenase